MKDLNTIISALNLMGLGGMGIFLFYLVKGLKERINSLTALAEEQKNTMEVVKERSSEMDRLSKTYKQAVDDFDEIGKKIEERRIKLIGDLEEANKKKDDDLSKLASLQIEELELKKRSLEKIPKLEKQLQESISELKHQIEIVSPDKYSNKPEYKTGHFEQIPGTPFSIYGGRGTGKTWFINYLNQKGILSELDGKFDAKAVISQRINDFLKMSE